MKTRDEYNDPPDASLEAPPALIDALKQIPKEQLFIPPTVDEAILRTARRHLAPVVRPWRLWGNWRLWLATATAAVLLLLVVWLPSARLTRMARTEISEDLNHDGRVDILDAFLLARKLQAGKVDDRHFDLNGDGEVDDSDVANLAARVVKLRRGDHS